MKIQDKKNISIKKLIFVFITILSLVLVEVLFSTSILYDTLGLSIFQAAENKGLDILMNLRGTRENKNDVVMIQIDEYTDKLLGWPIPRSCYGAIIAFLSDAGAKAVILDVTLPPRSDVDSTENALLVKYLSIAKNTFQVIGPYVPSKKEKVQISRKHVDSTAHFAIGKFGIPAPPESHFPVSPFIDDYPFPELAEVSTGIGHILVIKDSLDGVLRTAPLYVEYAGRLYPSVGFAAALNALGIKQSQVKFIDNEDGTLVQAGPLLIQTGQTGELLINYAGKNDIFPAVSFYDLFDEARKANKEFFKKFKDKVCIIGPTIKSLGDYYTTPVEDVSPGFYVHANMYDMVVSNAFIEKAPQWLQLTILITLMLIISFISYNGKLRNALLTLFVCIVLYVGFSVFIFDEYSVWFYQAKPLSGILICFVGTIAYRATAEGKQRKMIEDMFSTYLDNNVVKILIENPSLAQLGGERHEITILFTDVQGFSSISETTSEDALVRLLNTYFTEMTSVILANGGTVDKFIGDSIMAFWGAPIPDTDSAYNACITSLEMQERLARIQPKLIKISKKEIKQRVGINTGTCIIGNMGSEQKKNYTAMGDPVNLASRLEGVNKQYGTNILISEYTYQKIANRFVVREIDRVQVVGKSEGVRIYELLSSADKPLNDKMKYFLDIYTQGLKAYQERKWDEGIAFMEHALQYLPNDSVCQLYIERMKLYKITPPPENWDGVFVLHSK